MSLIAAVLASLLSVSSCWNLYAAAMRQSAQAPHPRFISYDEQISIQAHGEQMVDERTHVEYRDDGVAIVDGENGRPIVTTRLEPGPPELGPYGSARAGWMNDGLWPQLPAVADINVQGSESCENAGLVNESGTQTYHLLFHRPGLSPGLKALWVDAQTAEVHRAIVTGLVMFTGSAVKRLADFDLRLSHEGAFNVIRRVTLNDDDVSAEYTLDDFAFPTTLTMFDSIAPQIVTAGKP